MSETPEIRTAPKSLAIAERGIMTTQDFLNLMSAITSDVLSSRITTQQANSVTNAGGKMLKAAEMQQKYGTTGKDNRRRLELGEGDDAAPVPA